MYKNKNKYKYINIYMYTHIYIYIYIYTHSFPYWFNLSPLSKYARYLHSLWSVLILFILFQWSWYLFLGKYHQVILAIGHFLFLKMFYYLLLRETEHERGRSREKEKETQNFKQAPGSELSAQSLTRGPNPQTARSWPELRSDAPPTEPPRRPAIGHFPDVLIP